MPILILELPLMNLPRCGQMMFLCWDKVCCPGKLCMNSKCPYLAPVHDYGRPVRTTEATIKWYSLLKLQVIGSIHEETVAPQNRKWINNTYVVLDMLLKKQKLDDTCVLFKGISILLRQHIATVYYRVRYELFPWISEHSHHGRCGIAAGQGKRRCQDTEHKIWCMNHTVLLVTDEVEQPI